jgi:hypothetical protein
MKMISLFLVLFVSFKVFSDEIKLINQVLFEINKEAVTTTDFKNYLKTKQELKFQHLMPLVQNELEEFILFKLSALEVQNIDFNLSDSEELKIKHPEHKKVIEVQNFLKLKERHFGQLNRYKSWTDILKRKYNYLPKIDELKN